MPISRGDITVHLGPKEQGGPDSLVEPIVAFIDKARKRQKLQIAVQEIDQLRLLVDGAHVHRVEGMQVQNGLDVPGASGQLVHPARDVTLQRVGVQQQEPAVGPSHQGRVRADLHETTDLVRPPDVPEAVGHLDNALLHE